MKIGLAGAGRIGSMHAEVLARLDAVSELVLADVDAERTDLVAAKVGAQSVPTVPALFEAGLDGIVIAAATDAHTQLITTAVARGIPVFCEKPVAVDVEGTLGVIEAVEGSGVPVQVGFQRRFDPGYRQARAAVGSGRLGWIHTVRSCTLDAAPPPAVYVRSSGGLYRDCAVHDFDSIRWVTGREIISVYAVGANRGAAFFADHDDVDTASALLTLDDDTLAVVSCSRYNAAGYDVRLEVLGEKGSVAVGLDDNAALESAEPGATFPSGVAHAAFPQRFAAAYVAELRAFVHLVQHGGQSECTPQDALQAFYAAEACEISRRERRPVSISEVVR
ncbi:MAG: Gfo/Idh/MocA family oxidoreductase [Nocardioidaceae bacterium]|nr:Gfo/Idh/MocA family oxidoreductase [Nocardioidaceae bacterium]